MKSKKETVTIFGYGSQGQALALNLKDSGYDVIVGLPAKSQSRTRANRDGIPTILPTSDAARVGKIFVFALPDHLHGRVYQQEIGKHLPPRPTLVFLHGLSVHFGFVVPPDEADVILIAPHAPGVAVRDRYLKGGDLSAFYGVYQDSSGRAEKTALKLARAVGFKKDRLVKTTFEHEAIGDLFGEQAVLCGGVPELILKGYQVLVEKGVPAENAYLEVAYQLDLIVELIKTYGIEGMYQRISVTAAYGASLVGPELINENVSKRMASVYQQIASGKFPKQLNKLSDKELTDLRQRIKRLVVPSFERLAKKYSRKQ